MRIPSKYRGHGSSSCASRILPAQFIHPNRTKKMFWPTAMPTYCEGTPQQWIWNFFICSPRTFIYFVGLPEHWLSLESPDHQERDRGCCNAATVTSERVCRTNIKRIRNAIATQASAFFVVALLVFPVAARGPFLRRRRLIYDSSCEFLLGCLPPSRPACLINALLVQTRRRSWILTRPFHP